jgi:hypothetical protein
VIVTIPLYALTAVATVVVAQAFVRALHDPARRPHGRRRAIAAVALLLLALGVFVVVRTTLWANGDVDIGWLGIPGAVLLVATMLLTAVDPARAGALLRLGALLLLPTLVVLTLGTYLFERAEWREASIGPIVGGTLFFVLPALVVGRLARMAGRTPVPPPH